MVRFLIGGSPCTHWSIAQNKSREKEPVGLGWELFKNYLIAREKFRPDFFLYENNKSASPAIKDSISDALGVPLQYIDSALVSAQKRQRFYAHNFGAVPQPADRGILLSDVLESGIVDRDKARYLKHQSGNARDYFKKRHTQIAFEPADPLIISRPHGFNAGGAKYGKSPTLTANGKWQDNNFVVESACCGKCLTDGERGASTGLYAVPAEAYAGRVVGRRINEHGHRDDYNPDIERRQRFEVNDDPQKTNTLSTVDKDNAIAIRTNERGTLARVREVKDGFIEYGGILYPVRLPDGFYIIRKLTVTECCRLQTLPDDYCRAVSDTQAYKGLGNGWTAEIVIHLLKYALRGIPKDEKIIVLSMYDGIGTGRYCFEQLGYTNLTYHAYEIDKYAIRIAQSNFPDIVQRGDAFAVRESEWQSPRADAPRRAAERTEARA